MRYQNLMNMVGSVVMVITPGMVPTAGASPKSGVEATVFQSWRACLHRHGLLSRSHRQIRQS